jgi:branched-chain amino acid transport system permease protein
VLYNIELLINGLLVGSLYALIALGFVLIIKATDIINFAQGEFVMLAGFIMAAGLHTYGLNLAFSIVLGVIGMIILALVVNRLVLQYMIGRPVVSVIMATIGLAAFLQGFATFVWGVDTKNIPLPITEEPLFIFDVLLSPMELAASAASFICIGLVSWWFIKTRTGVALRAIADDQQVALAMGINVRYYFGITWAVAGIIAVVGGIVWGHLLGVDVQLALVGLKVFPVVILGGLDSIVGAIVGGLIIGVIESIAAGYLDPLVGGGTKDFTPYVIMILVLMFKPYGLFGQENIERV